MDDYRETAVVLLILTLLFGVCLGAAIKGQHDRCQRLAASHSAHLTEYCR